MAGSVPAGLSSVSEKPAKASAAAFQAAALVRGLVFSAHAKPIKQISRVAVGVQLESGAGSIQTTCDRPLGRTDQSPIDLQEFGLGLSMLTRLEAEQAPYHGCTTRDYISVIALLSRAERRESGCNRIAIANGIIDVRSIPTAGRKGLLVVLAIFATGAARGKALAVLTHKIVERKGRRPTETWTLIELDEIEKKDVGYGRINRLRPLGSTA